MEDLCIMLLHLWIAFFFNARSIGANLYLSLLQNRFFNFADFLTPQLDPFRIQVSFSLVQETDLNGKTKYNVRYKMLDKFYSVVIKLFLSGIYYETFQLSHSLFYLAGKTQPISTINSDIGARHFICQYGGMFTIFWILFGDWQNVSNHWDKNVCQPEIFFSFEELNVSMASKIWDGMGFILVISKITTRNILLL